jgi:biotin operon repressor
MSAVPDNIVPFTLPKKPRIKEKDAPPDQRKVAVLPIRAVFDKELTHGALTALAALCAYCNRAGITWVSQTRLASELGITQQAVAKQFRQLKDRGYLQIVKQGFKGQRTATLRVIYDPSITAEDAITMVSNKEDARPPYMKEEQAKQMQEQSDPEGQRRIAQLIAKALKNPNPKPERTMPKSGETRAVREVKEAMAKAKAKRSTSVEKTVDNTSIHNPQVVQLKDQSEPSIHNLEVVPNHNLGVVLNTDIEHRERDIKSRVKDKVINKPNVLHNLEVSDFDFLIDNKMKPEQIEEALATLLPLFAAEGLNPTSKVLADSILQLHRDTR